MIVFTTLMVFGCIGFFVPKAYLKRYMFFSAICISSLYFFYTPPMAYDLSRHYEFLHKIRNLDLRTLLSGEHESSNYVLNEYMDNSKVYLVYAYIISQFRVDALLPVITGIIIYGAVSKIIIMSAEDVGGDIEDWKIAFCFFFLLMMTDFRTISGIRNMLAYALFAYVLYKDLVRNANKLFCFFAYFLFANIHTSITILIVIRLLLGLEKISPKWVLMILAFLAFSFLDIIIQPLSRMADVPFIHSLISKINNYGHGGGTSYVLRRGVIRLFLTLIYLLLYLFVKRNKYLPDLYQKFSDFYLYYLLFTLGAIQQYDIFVRSNIILYFLIFPFMLSFLKHAVGKRPNDLILSNHSIIGFTDVSVYLMICAAIFVSVALYLREYYTPMDSGFLGLYQG